MNKSLIVLDLISSVMSDTDSEYIDKSSNSLDIDLNMIYLSDFSLDDDYSITSLSSTDILSNFIEPVQTLQFKVVINENEDTNIQENTESLENNESYYGIYMISSLLCIIFLFGLIYTTLRIRRRNRIYNLTSVINIDDNEQITEMSNMI